VSGRIVKRETLTDSTGSCWEVWITRWDDGSFTAQFHTPEDPDHPFYGTDGPRFSLADARGAVDAASDTAREIAAISEWLDGSYPEDLDPETLRWRRCAKVCEEAGEVIQAIGGVSGENPRKGVTHTVDDLIGELLDVAVAALGAVEHLTGARGRSLDLMSDKVRYVINRAGLVTS
jgi:NTP pyrophosphatase (non-canonical NTP hydrolase)